MNKNDYAPIAPMGWNSYDYYDTTVNEEQVRANADYLAEHLKDAGYEYVVVDIEWYAKKAGSQRNTYQYIPYSELAIDEYSRLQPDPERFPSSADGTGFKALADYVHSLGLKFGIHIMRGIPRIAAHTHMAVKKTDWTANQIADPSSICGWNPDMYGVRNCEAGQAYYDSLLEMCNGNIVNDSCVSDENRDTYSSNNKSSNSSSGSKKKTFDDSKRLVSINTGTLEELMTLSGVGESKAKAIIEYRNKKKFETIEEIKEVSGIGDALFEKIKDNITV